MIASYLHNFIFIKTKKTGGTVVEAVLAHSCGPEDIVTPLGPHDELVRSNSKAPLVARNFGPDPDVERRITEAVLQQDKKAYNVARRECAFYSHMTAEEVKWSIDPVFWKRAYKFTVERHPYEKAVSSAYFGYSQRRDPPFPEYLDSYLRAGSYSSFPYYTIDGQVVMNRILRQEHLHRDLREIGESLGFDVPEELPVMKTRSRKDSRSARDILSDAQKEIVYAICKPEFELMGYEP